MPPSNCLASSSRSSHSAAIFRKPLTADGLSRFTTSLLERSAGWSHPNPVRGRLRVAILSLQRCTPTMEPYIYNNGMTQVFQKTTHLLAWRNLSGGRFLWCHALRYGVPYSCDEHMLPTEGRSRALLHQYDRMQVVVA